MDAKDYIKNLHQANDGFITIAKNQDTWKQQYFNDINKINIIQFQLIHLLYLILMLVLSALQLL